MIHTMWQVYGHEDNDGILHIELLRKIAIPEKNKGQAGLINSEYVHKWQPQKININIPVDKFLNMFIREMIKDE